MDPARSDGGLRYNASTGTYVFKWRTAKSWAGTCRTFVLKLSDGSVQRLNLKFRKNCPPLGRR